MEDLHIVDLEDGFDEAVEEAKGRKGLCAEAQKLTPGKAISLGVRREGVTVYEFASAEEAKKSLWSSWDGDLKRRLKEEGQGLKVSIKGKRGVWYVLLTKAAPAAADPAPAAKPKG